MKLKAQFLKALKADDGTFELFLSTRDAGAVKALKSLSGQDISVECKKWRNPRSHDANAYFHVLVDEIAKASGKGADEVKVEMVLEYGTIARDDEGASVGIKLPKSVDVRSIYKYAKWFDERNENGKLFNCYIIYKKTRALDSAEMARLIDGVVHEAQQLGIDTRTPEQLAEMKSLWGKINDDTRGHAPASRKACQG